MTPIKVNGINNLTKFFILIFFLFLIMGCKTIKQEILSHNYIVGEKNKGDLFYNDSIDVSIDFLENTIYDDLSKIKRSSFKSELRGIKEVSVDNLILSSKKIDDEMKMYYFFEKVETPIDTLLHERLIKNDIINGVVICEKQKGRKKIICVTKSLKNRDDVLRINNENMKRVYLDSTNLKKITSFNIFNYYTNNCINFLQGRDKLQKAPFTNPKRSIWKKTFIMTLNSFMSNNKEYDELISNHENEKDHFDKTIEFALSLKGVKKNDSVFTSISELAKNNQVIMLNEDHFYPKHRLFAMQLLDVLKQNEFTYLSIEAFTPNREGDTTIIPNSKNGLYTKEPYFGHFIRKAKKMGFTIVGHENYDSSIDREIGQAKNIMKILERDPKAKIFVYAGHGHIEKEGERRHMASYFREFSKINPITINQEALISKTKENLVLIPKSVFEKDTLMKSSADYFVVNNLETNLTSIYPDKVFKTVFVQNNDFKKFRKEELLLEIYNGNEYEQTKNIDLLIPISASLVKTKGSKIRFSLPVGKYYVVVKSANNQRFKFDNFEVK
ncbi:hypothetical protein [Flavobacterium soyae]|uniref:hypothetical protein n=1 Tax=Flavobacterium soyae TaxID=2903098 RepID=UPI001E2C2A77|nr:hypothetical protein [Flavobacterium soyae]MCD9576275.1 hypothetical protein [Flavobacterium soyae]